MYLYFHNAATIVPFYHCIIKMTYKSTLTGNDGLIAIFKLVIDVYL